jgi:hypothetical protein
MGNSINNIRDCFSDEEIAARPFSVLLNIAVWFFLFHECYLPGTIFPQWSAQKSLKRKLSSYIQE